MVPFLSALALKGRLHAELRDPQKIFVSVLGGSRSGDWSGSWSWIICITWCWSIFPLGREFVGFAGSHGACGS